MANPDETNLFAAGERLSQPSGDPSREAVAALRGFAYQLYASALAWLRLTDGEVLFLEVAEDYAKVTKGALEGVQAKDRPDDVLTIRSAAQSIDAYVDLVLRNPERRVSFRHLTTAGLGVERAKRDRVDNGPAIAYWGLAAAGAPVSPLRKVLLSEPPFLKPQTVAFIKARGDDALRDDLIRPIRWLYGTPGLDELREDLEAGLIEFAVSVLRADGGVGRNMLGAVMERVLSLSANAGSRQLRPSDLIEIGEAIGSVTLKRVDFERLLSGLLGRSPSVSLVSTLLIPGAVEPSPLPRAPRLELIGKITGVLAGHGVAIIHGATGMGKTSLAQRVAAGWSRDWRIVEFRDLDRTGMIERLDAIRGEIIVAGANAVILDDASHLDDPAVSKAIAGVCALIRRQGGTVLISTAGKPAQSVAVKIGGSAEICCEVPYLSASEIRGILEEVDGTAPWAEALLTLTSGHPLLVQASVLHLQMEGWRQEALTDLLGGHAMTLQSERDSARRRLVDVMPPDARRLLFRTSLVIGRFARKLALALGEVVPEISEPGIELDRLIGPWIEISGRDSCRVSPLMHQAGSDALGLEEQARVHAAIVRFMTASDVATHQASALLLHALSSGDRRLIHGIAQSIIMADERSLASIARWSPVLIDMRTDRPLWSGDPTVSAMLRLAQLLLALVGARPAAVQAIWSAFEREEPHATPLGGVRQLMLFKVLMVERIAQRLPQWLDLVIEFDAAFDPAGARGGPVAERVAEDLPSYASGLMFAGAAIGIETTSGLLSVLERLDGFSADIRERLFSLIANERGDFAVLVNAPWIKAVKQAGFDLAGGIGDYRAMAALAVRWGNLALALRCHVCIAIMLDEYGKDQRAALDALREAEAVLGPSPILARGRAKIHWRGKDHPQALENINAIWNDLKEGPIEQAHLAREAAISSAELGLWHDAVMWFARARSALEHLSEPVYKAMSVGLLGDQARAAFEAGKARDSVALFAQALDALGSLNPEGHLQEVYTHRVVRHAIVWLLCRFTGEYPEGIDARLPAGACSNPDPPETIRTKPLGPIDLSWYVVAQLQEALVLEPKVIPDIAVKLVGGPALGLEITVLAYACRACLQTGDVARFMELLPREAAVRGLFAEHSAELMSGNVTNPTRGTVTAVALDGLEDKIAAHGARDFTLAFGIAAALRQDAVTLSRLRDAVVAAGVVPVRGLARLMAGGERTSIENLEYLAEAIAQLARRGDSDPMTCARIGARLTYFVGTSNYRSSLETPLMGWLENSWRGIIRDSRFRLVSPAVTVPLLDEALTSGSAPIAKAAAICIAAARAVKLNLGVIGDSLSKLDSAD